MSATPDNFKGLSVGVLARLTNIDMTTAAAFNVCNATSKTIALTHVCFENFSAFAVGVAFPATWACSWGTNSVTTPTNMFNAAIGTTAIIPFVIAQPMLAVSPYIQPGQALWFAVVTTTNGVGTIGAITFCGGFIS